MMIIYGRMLPNYFWQYIMYTIYINNQVKLQTDDKNLAWSSYRSFAKDYPNKPNLVQIFDGSTLLHQKEAEDLLLDDVDGAKTNDVLVCLVNHLGIETKQAKAIIKNSGLNVSNSRINGWFCQPNNRHFTKLYHDELIYLLPYFINDTSTQSTRVQNELGFTPNNLKTMRKQIGLSQQAVADIVGVSGNRQVRRWENGEQDMPSDRWQVFLDFFNKNQK